MTGPLLSSPGTEKGTTGAKPQIDVLLSGHSTRLTNGFLGFCSTVLIEGAKRTIVDAGHVGRRKALLEALAERGLTPADIDVSVLTHAHWDHVQNLDLFDHAPTMIHPLERAYAQNPHVNDWVTPRWTGAMLETQPFLQDVTDGFEIEPGVRIVHTPGHTPGCISVLVHTDNGIAAVVGDVLHTAEVAVTRQNPLVFWSVDEATSSIDLILHEAEVIYPGHDRPFRLLDGERIEYLSPPDTMSGHHALRWDRSPSEPWVMPGIEDQRVPGAQR